MPFGGLGQMATFGLTSSAGSRASRQKYNLLHQRGRNYENEEYK